ncbi:MAG: hypothetical protein JRN68_01795 [Nitrososphaerota archaeon]|nr:hypothetical protein [Nitrososphaerota archaeon]
MSKHQGSSSKAIVPKKRVPEGAHAPSKQPGTTIQTKQLNKLNSMIKILQLKASKLNSELKDAERKRRTATFELQRAMKQRDSLKRSLIDLEKIKKRKEAELKSVSGELGKAKHSLDTIKQMTKQTVKERNEASAAIAKASKELESVQKQLVELKRNSEELSSSNAALQMRMDETTSKIRDLQLTAALSDFFLAADIDGLEKWIVQDTPLVLEYMKQVRDKPYFDVYREYLYSRLLKKAYRLYECANCKKRFRAESGEPKSCPFCGHTVLKLIDVAREIVQEPPSSRLILPKPEERPEATKPAVSGTDYEESPDIR